jgi:hypothetical protein
MAAATKVYLLQSRANSIYADGELELTATTLRCRVTGHAGWPAKELRIPDLKERLAAGEAMTAFEFRRDGLKVEVAQAVTRWRFRVSHDGGRAWTVSLIHPSGLMSVFDAVNDPLCTSNGARRWRQR